MSSKNVSLFFFAVVVINIAVGAYFFVGKQKQPPLDLSVPSMAVDSLSAKALYFSPAARAYLLAHRPELVLHPSASVSGTAAGAAPGKDSQEAEEDLALQFAQAAQEPDLWRQLARQFQFDTVLLTGEPGEYRPLLRHLLASKDWTLSYLDHTSLIFRRYGEKSWIPDDLNAALGNSVGEKGPYAHLSGAQRAAVLSQLSTKLLAINQYGEAKRCLDQAVASDKSLPEAWNAKALYNLHFGQWPEALENANKALELDENFLPALSAKAHILFTLHKFPEALKVSQRLVKESPNNPQVLLLHAKIAHEAEEFGTEAETLVTIIGLAEQQHTSVTGYRLFLAQAYAHNGEAMAALDQFHQVLACPDITEEQRQSVNDCIAAIQKKIEPPAQ